MKIYSLNDLSTVPRLAAILEQGGVLAGASDTVPGLLAAATEQGKKSIDSIKQREKKPYILLVDEQWINENVDPAALERWRSFMALCWPGPVTVVLPAKKQMFDACGATVAVRIPAYQPLNDLIARIGPLFSTSANKAGQKPPLSAEQIDDDIKNQVAGLLIEPAPTSDQQLNAPSALLDLTGAEGRIVVLRDREPLVTELEKQYGQAFVRISA